MIYLGGLHLYISIPESATANTKVLLWSSTNNWYYQLYNIYTLLQQDGDKQSALKHDEDN